MKKGVTLNFRVAEDLHVRLKMAAKRRNISLASIIRMICSEWMEREDKEAI